MATIPTEIATKTPVEGKEPSAAHSALNSLRHLRKSENVLYAKNNSGNKITCREFNGQIKVDFDLDPQEMAIIPKEALYVPGFLRLWMKGAVTVSDDDEMENELLLSMDGLVTAQQNERKRVMETMNEPASHNDIEQKLCLVGQEPVFQRSKDTTSGVPPLCDLHKHQAAEFVPTQQPNGSWTFQRAVGVTR